MGTPAPQNESAGTADQGLILRVVPIRVPEDINLILGQSHFIKTVEDLHEALAGAVPGIQFGLAFCEASGPALVRWSGTDDELTALAREALRELGTGHAFLILLRNAFPINVLPAVRAVQEVCGIYCATANPVQVIVAETEQGRGILGVIDGIASKGIETEEDIAARTALLRRFGYKAG
jgi:adenosine/AMP kinase